MQANCMIRHLQHGEVERAHHFEGDIAQLLHVFDIDDDVLHRPVLVDAGRRVACGTCVRRCQLLSSEISVWNRFSAKRFAS